MVQDQIRPIIDRGVHLIPAITITSDRERVIGMNISAGLAVLLVFLQFAGVVSSFAGVDTDGAIDLKWGYSPAKAKEIMAKRQAVYDNRDDKINEQASKVGQLFMTYKGTFMERPATATLIFYENKLFKVNILFDDITSETVYFGLSGMLEIKYGKPSNYWKSDIGHSAIWDGPLTSIYLHQMDQRKTSGSIFTFLEYSDWKTDRIAHDREAKFNKTYHQRSLKDF